MNNSAADIGKVVGGRGLLRMFWNRRHRRFLCLWHLWRGEREFTRSLRERVRLCRGLFDGCFFQLCIFALALDYPWKSTFYGKLLLFLLDAKGYIVEGSVWFPLTVIASDKCKYAGTARRFEDSTSWWMMIGVTRLRIRVRVRGVWRSLNNEFTLRGNWIFIWVCAVTIRPRQILCTFYGALFWDSISRFGMLYNKFPFGLNIYIYVSNSNKGFKQTKVEFNSEYISWTWSNLERSVWKSWSTHILMYRMSRLFFLFSLYYCSHFSFHFVFYVSCFLLLVFPLEDMVITFCP